ncbi:DUF447 domain-containing protein [Azospirillum halopraeferens]|uniref:DUF447 domain-containing protein n=1 Tax=Azospirillum halopraeferens TaxID=34010 RepID=UPI0004297615|nr:DUF447 domain-containing protein [Azospirillum halopraeferens]
MIREIVVVTLSPDGTPHAAPMGLILPPDGAPVLSPFRPSRTLDNLMARRQAVLNYTDDVRVFAGCVCGRRDWPTRPARRVAGGVLETALAHAEVEVVRVEDDPVRPRFTLSIVHEETHAPFRGLNRAKAAVIEGAVLVSRLHLLPARQIDAEMEHLAVAVRKTAAPEEAEAWQWLVDHVAAWRAGRAAGTAA